MPQAAAEVHQSAAQPLRVGLLCHQFPVISETFVATLAASLMRRGHDLRVLAASAKAPAGASHAFVREAGIDGKISYAVPSGRFGPGRALALARGAPSRALFLLALAAMDPLFRDKTAVTRLMAASPPFDVVHAQFGYLGLTAMRHRAYGTLRCRALVVHLRGFDITRFVIENGEDVYAELFRKADLFIANCHHFRDRAIALGCDPAKVEVIGSPIDTDRFAPPERRAPVEGRAVRTVLVGRLVEKKGISDAIAAVALLRDTGRNVTLDVLGEGPLRPALEAQIAEAGLQDRVRLHGAADQDQVIATLHAADIALAPSVRAADGDEDAPVNTLKEAMATELPVIATRHGGIPELVIPGENGDLVPERNPQALADSVAAMLDKPQTWPDMGRAGRQKVIAEYDHDHIVEKTVRAYETALKRSGDLR
ncbi:glycosyltransferase [Palleronia sp.]|uniref:glycosyltransferase n=1 Tax=Palleronia sp. TaxID=1940284 RepID=UPI0035C80324